MINIFGISDPNFRMKNLAQICMERSSIRMKLI